MLTPEFTDIFSFKPFKVILQLPSVFVSNKKSPIILIFFFSERNMTVFS